MSRAFRCLCICTLVLTCSLSVAQDKNPEFKNENNDLNFTGSRAEIYKQTDQGPLKIHIFEPKDKSEEPRSAIVFFFGGGWRAGSPRQFEQHCRYLASHGMVAMTADYRVSKRHQTKAVAAVQDAKSAVRWIREHHNELNIDKNKIAVGGGSAGGHLAACTATIKAFEAEGENLRISSKPNALVLYNPAVTLAPFDGQQPLPEDKSKQDGGLEKRMGTVPINLSPAHHVTSDLPPTIMFFGTEDFLLDGAKFFHEQMKSSRNRCEFVLYEGQAHGFFNYGKSKNKYFIETLRSTHDFLKSIGYLDSDENIESWLDQQPTSKNGK